ncbi:MAG: alpha-mannosidase [Chloroflexi bacterium]|nr:alpha-mannosidase [Chloroflexota bacterium]
MRHQIRFTEDKLDQRIALIEPLVYRRRLPLEPFRYQPIDGPLTLLDGSDSLEHAPNLPTETWPSIAPRTYWGQQDVNFVMAGAFQVPGTWDTDQPLALHLPIGNSRDFSHPEALVYIDGAPYATIDRHHDELHLPNECLHGQAHRLLLRGWTGLLGGTHIPPGPQLFMGECALVQIDQPTRAFIAAARAALDTAVHLSADNPVKDRLLNALDDAFKILDTREPFGPAFYASVLAAHSALRAGVAAAGQPLDVAVIATGHAHIDVAWLWTLGQTRGKAGRTFHNVLRLMEQFPEYHFTQSQPQLYDYVQQDYPALFDAIKARVAEGRWEVIGGMWVEADCNISGPESLARQFLLGRSFFREHFGADAESPVLWLPDVFGYAWNLPQLIKLAGLEYFFTIKIGWNRYNRLPVDSFWWQGLDGTKVLTHFSTSPEAHDIHSRATYNVNLNAATTLGTWLNNQQPADVRTLLMSFGWGDGGGGPTREMLEQACEVAAMPGIPRLRQASVKAFFETLEAESGDNLPTWNGELYFELHRGTYTTQSRNKRANRRSEFLLHDAEFVATVASLLDSAYAYPYDTFRKAWELVCLNQFHDIIPGSSITAVYTESLEQYAEVERLGTAARDAALAVVAEKLGGDLLLVNPTDFHRRDLVFWPGKLEDGQRLVHAAPWSANTPIHTQAAQGGTWIDAKSLPPLSVIPLRIEAGEPATIEDSAAVRAEPRALENSALRVELNDAGDIIRVYDKLEGREVLPPGAVANQFQAFEDRPLNWDAWDIDIFYDDKMWLSDPATSIEVVESGPLRATIAIKRRILNSNYTQRLSLSCKNELLTMETTIDWRERHMLLKAAFPVDILAPTATYEVQWGHVQRPTHRNTSWDWARFETVAQKWVDLSEGDYGVAVINDCKYGHDIRDNVIRVSLLRAPTQPDPDADQGEHRFTLGLLPQEKRVCTTYSGVVEAAYLLNDPVIVHQGVGTEINASLGYRYTPVSSSGTHPAEEQTDIIETVKRAEDGDGIIVRLYEFQRTRGTLRLQTHFPLRAAYITNLLEDNQTPLDVEDNAVMVPIKPFQIITLRLIPA